MPKKPTPHTQHDGIFVIFGITGDLAKRKLIPSLYKLIKLGVVSDDFRILATTRKKTTVEEVMDSLRAALKEASEPADEVVIKQFARRLTMVDMDIGKQEDYASLKHALEQTERSINKSVNYLYYLAVPPAMFDPIVASLHAHGLHNPSDNLEGAHERRLLIEKPFGYDTASAIELIRQMEHSFTERSIYRVDHYLAKETAQNILTFRFHNPMFEAVWDRHSIDHIMITAAEKIGIEGRVNFYESTGALRDLIQSHLLQLLALVTMEEPEDRTALSIHKAKLALLDSIPAISAKAVNERAVRGQYEGYRHEVNNPETRTETFAAIRLDIDNERWRDVPVLLRTGKAMAQKVTEISLIFKSRGKQSKDRNALTIRIQPKEGIVMTLRAKKPSLRDDTEMVQMAFNYHQSFSEEVQPDAYERVLLDAIRGDKTLFTTDEEVLSSWRIVEAVLRTWEADDASLESYEQGSWGPLGADKLASDAAAQWLTNQLHIHKPKPDNT